MKQKKIFKLKRRSLIILLLSFLLTSVSRAQTIFSIGTKNNSAAEFALAPDKYEDFLKHDFGWEDRFYIVGLSDPKKDWPYILPGPDDGWGGTSGTAGIRSHVLNILFRLKDVPANSHFKLFIDFVDAHSKRPPLFKVTVNGISFKYELPKGMNYGSISGKYDSAVNYTIEIPLQNIIRSGSNEINLTSLEGSWAIFDDIRLEGPAGVALQETNKKAYLRGVSAANYQTTAQSQPLLVDVEHLAGSPTVTVKLNGKNILQQQLEKGRHVLEAPMPAVKSNTQSPYEILLDGKQIEKGTVSRAPQPIATPADYVDTRLGTAHSRWMIAPGPWMPFSMVKLSPDNQNSGWQAGYNPTFESIGTFSHIHEWTMTGLGTMPVNGPLKIKIGDQSAFKKNDSAYRSAIDKSTEETPLGYYKADLTDYGIKAELTATTRCSFQRYTYPQDKDGRVMIDLQIPTEYRYNILEGSLRQVNANTIEGVSVQQSKGVWSTDADQDYTVYFVMEFDQPIKNFGGWVNDKILSDKNINAVNPKAIGCFAEFDTKINPVVQVRTAISFVSLDGARKNLQQEVIIPFGWNFNAIRNNNKKVWNDILNRVQIESNDSREKMRFYTNFYRAFCRNIFSDVDGKWVDATEKIQQFKNSNDVALGCDAFWNTFWNLNQLWNLAAPEWSSRWVKSQLAMYDANGMLAKGPAGMEYIPVMVAEHEIPLLVSAYQMGIRDYDVEKMYTAVKKMQTTLPQRIGNGLAGNRDLATYLKHKFVPADSGRFSNTLEYSYDDWTVSQLAKALGKTEDYKIFSDRGNWWKNAIDTVTGYARMRYSNGKWEENFDPYKSGANHHYVEGNAWQLTYFVPQDVPGLAKMIGKDRFLERLTGGFKASETWRYNAPGDAYWDFPVVQGNQQSMHFAFLFNWVGEPWQTQHWSRSILERYYGYGTADAYLGDEDQGQMSAWFLMAALGLFQTDGGASVNPVYEIASPLYKKITINLGNQYGRGKQFIIKANGASKTNQYVQSAKLNGKTLNSFKFPASELLKGGMLELQMRSKPNKIWGVE